MTEYKPFSIDNKQKNWRAYSKSDNHGYFVWDVLDTDVTIADANLHQFTECRDGSYVLITYCCHFWSKEKAEEFFTECSEWPWVENIQVGTVNCDSCGENFFFKEDLEAHGTCSL